MLHASENNDFGDEQNLDDELRDPDYSPSHDSSSDDSDDESGNIAK